MNKINSYLSRKQAAEFLGVSGNTLKNWEKAGKIVVVRNPVNNYRMYKQEDLEALLKDIPGNYRQSVDE